MAVEQGLELVEHDDLERAGASSYTGVTLASEGTACWRARARRDSERYGRGSGERESLGNYRSATAAAVAVAQWERDHPCADCPRRARRIRKSRREIENDRGRAPSDCARASRAERRFSAADRRLWYVLRGQLGLGLDLHDNSPCLVEAG